MFFFFLSFNYVHCSHLFHTSFQVDSLHLSLTSFPWPRPFPRNISNTKECWSYPETLACHEDLVPVRASESTISVLPKGLYQPQPLSLLCGASPFLFTFVCMCVYTTCAHVPTDSSPGSRHPPNKGAGNRAQVPWKIKKHSEPSLQPLPQAL